MCDTYNKRYTLSSGDTSVSVGVSDGGPVLLSLKNERTGREWLSAPGCLPLPAGLGRAPAAWRFTGEAMTESEGQTVLTLTFAAPVENLTVTAASVWSCGRSGPVQHAVTLTNPGGADLTVTYMPAFKAALGAADPVLFSVCKGAITPGPVGETTEAVRPGEVLRIREDKIPIAFLSDGQERLYAAHVFGTGELVITGTPDGADVEVGLGADFMTDIPAGGTLAVPAAFFGTGCGTQDDVSNELNAWLYRHMTPDSVKTDTWPDVMFNIWNSIGGASPVSDEFMHTCDEAAALGIDRIILDYGWWDKIGEWDPAPYKWKGGMAPYGAYAKEKGLYYVMYYLFHNQNSTLPDALTAAGPNAHPEWFAEGGRQDDHADLGSRECAAFIAERLATHLNEFGIPGFRSDFFPVMAFSNQINRHKYGVDTQYWTYTGFHEVLDYLAAHVPDFNYENCCAGGLYKDYETMRRTTNIFSTDTYRAIDARQSFYDTSYCFPPAQIAPQTSCTGPDPAIWESWEMHEGRRYAYLYRSVMPGAMYFNFDCPVWELSADERAFLIRQIAVYKEWVRPLVRKAKLYHTTARPDNIHWDAVQYYDPDTGRGILFVFRPDNDEPTHTFPLYGLDPAADYLVRSEETGTTRHAGGAELLREGVTVSCGSVYWSDLIYIRRADTDVDEGSAVWADAAL